MNQLSEKFDKTTSDDGNVGIGHINEPIRKERVENKMRMDDIIG